jgi:hypothetical protein
MKLTKKGLMKETKDFLVDELLKLREELNKKSKVVVSTLPVTIHNSVTPVNKFNVHMYLKGLTSEEIIRLIVDTLDVQINLADKQRKPEVKQVLINLMHKARAGQIEHNGIVNK